MKPIRCVVVGAGATGSLLACFLKRKYGNKLSLQIWDKGRGAGGRMSTSRYSGDSCLSLDLGAQYISATNEYKTKHSSIYDELLENGILSPLTTSVEGMRTLEDTCHFITPGGVSTIPKYFLNQSGCSPSFNMNLNAVNIKENSLTACAEKKEDGAQNDKIQLDADIIVITMPIPQLLNLKGDISSCLDPLRQKLGDVSYSSRYALGLFYENSTELDRVDWVSRYVQDNPCLRFISFDSKKREKDSEGGLSLIAHASVPFSIKHLEENMKDIEKVMLDYLHKEIPNLPKADKTKVIRWRYSQVSKPFEGAPGHVVISKSPLIICAGDGFSHSNFDGCVDSAFSVIDTLKMHFPIN